MQHAAARRGAGAPSLVLRSELPGPSALLPAAEGREHVSAMAP